jgi:glycosyltransferase involved in cell wall biosynthesis
MVSVLFPTTGRPDAAEACLRQLRETAPDVEIIAAIDADPETEARLQVLADRITYSDEYRGCSRAWNDALALATGDPIVFAADDLEWHPGWLQAALKRLAEFPGGWGLVGFNDGHWNESLSTHYIMSRRFIVEVLGGVVAWDFYRHSFNDLEVNERAKRAGRYAWCQEAHVKHLHWTFGDRPKDDTDTRLLDEHGESERIYHEREAAGFPNDGITPVIRRRRARNRIEE